MRKRLVVLAMVSFAATSFWMPSEGFCEDLSSLASQEGEKVTVEGNEISIHQDLSEEAKKRNEKMLIKRKKGSEKISKGEAKMAKQIRKDKRIKEKAEAKQAAKLARKKKEWEWKQNR